MKRVLIVAALLVSVGVLAPLAHTSRAYAQSSKEITPESQEALRRGLEWLYENQGPEGNWGSNDLGLVSMGALAFMAAGHTPGRDKYGKACQKALMYVIKHSKEAPPDALLINSADPQRDMYNHGLSTFVLGQAYGMSNDPALGKALDKALKLITKTQCDDGGWDYKAKRQQAGHDLSLAVMQAKALRSAMDSGFEVPREVTDIAIKSVRQHYTSEKGRSLPEEEMRKFGGQFTYTKGGGAASLAMAAAGVVCLQEFGQYDDWRIPKNMVVIKKAVLEKCKKIGTKDEKDLRPSGELPFDAYTLYYLSQALYQTGGDDWKTCYPKLRDYVIRTQVRPDNGNRGMDKKDIGKWHAGGHVAGRAGELYGTAAGCFLLAIPNRFLPILQEGRIKIFE